MFDPDENLGLAAKARDDKKMGDDAGIRAAVSRCHYSSLLTAEPHLEALPNVGDSADFLIDPPSRPVNGGAATPLGSLHPLRPRRCGRGGMG